MADNPRYRSLQHTFLDRCIYFNIQYSSRYQIPHRLAPKNQTPLARFNHSLCHNSSHNYHLHNSRHHRTRHSNRFPGPHPNTFCLHSFYNIGHFLPRILKRKIRQSRLFSKTHRRLININGKLLFNIRESPPTISYIHEGRYQ